MTLELTHGERAALRLLRLCIAPRKSVVMQYKSWLVNDSDADGMGYDKHIEALEAKGYIRRNPADNRVIELVAVGVKS